MEFDKVVDSGKHREFETGAKRDTKEGKGRYDLLPPFAIHRLAKHFENGAKKYSSHNWEKGMSTWEYLDSALRHVFKYLGGSKDEDHLIAAAWNILCCVDTQERVEKGILPKEIDTISKHLDNTFLPVKKQEN